jgi:hypothetical protein
LGGLPKVLATEDNEENKDFDLTAEKLAKPSDTNSTNSHQSTQPESFWGKPYVVRENSWNSCPWHPWLPYLCAEAKLKKFL